MSVEPIVADRNEDKASGAKQEATSSTLDISLLLTPQTLFRWCGGTGEASVVKKFHSASLC